MKLSFKIFLGICIPAIIAIVIISSILITRSFSRKIDSETEKDRYIMRNCGINKNKYHIINSKIENCIKALSISYSIRSDENWQSNLNYIMNELIFGKSKVSVVIPVYNVEKYLNKCVESVLAQTYRNLEILLVNDGSTDDSAVICNLLAQKDCRIQVINQENGGLAAARNTGISNSTGEYIMFIDSDDYISNYMVEELLRNAKKADADVSCGRAFIYNRLGKLVNYCDDPEKIEEIDNNIAEYLSGKITIAAWDKLYKRKAIEGILFDSTLFNEDADFILKLCLSTLKFVVTNKQYYYYIKRTSGSITGTAFKSKCFETWYWSKKWYNNIRAINPLYGDIFLYNSVAHILRLYKRDYVPHSYIFKEQINDMVSDLMDLILNTQYIDSFPDLDNVLSIIDDLKEDGVLDSTQMPYKDLECIGIIWNSLSPDQVNEAIDILQGHARIIAVKTIDLQAKYRDFIFEIYKYNNEKIGIPVFKSSVLIDRYDSNSITIVLLRINVYTYIHYSQKKGYLFKEPALLKDIIRQYFIPRIKDYAFDNIFHLTMNEDEFEFTKRVCSKYNALPIKSDYTDSI